MQIELLIFVRELHTNKYMRLILFQVSNIFLAIDRIPEEVMQPQAGKYLSTRGKII